MHWWANQVRLWLVLKMSIVWIYQVIRQRLSLQLYIIHPAWLPLTNQLKFDDWCYQINSLSLINLLLLIIKWSFICEGQSCRVRISVPMVNRKVTHTCNTNYWCWLQIKLEYFFYMSLPVIVLYSWYIFRTRDTVIAMHTVDKYTAKPVYNDHLMGYFSAFWSSSRWPRAT